MLLCGSPGREAPYVYYHCPLVGHRTLLLPITGYAHVLSGLPNGLIANHLIISKLNDSLAASTP